MFPLKFCAKIARNYQSLVISREINICLPSRSLQSLLFFVSCTRSLVAAARGVEVIGYGERDAARKIVGILSADDISTIIRPPLTIALGQV